MIRNILLSQKEELNKKLNDRYISRDIKFKNLKSDLIKIISGPRRSGKSFFVIHELTKKGIKFGYANFDDERLTLLKNYDEIVSLINTIYRNPEYIFFDEIQNLPKWELFVNRLQRAGRNIILTGSNSKLLSSELATHLTGRYSETIITTFSFKEFLKIEQRELQTFELLERFSSYMETGGYPEILVKELEQTDYLKDLFDSVIYKDIIKRHKLRISKAIDNLSTYLLSNIANEFSYRNVSETIIAGSINTVRKYINLLEEAYLFFQLNKFSFKVKEQISSNKKIYCIDNGFIRARGFLFSENRGKLLENLVAIELMRRAGEDKSEIYYWKNQQKEEVDFVIKKGLKISELIQVCYGIRNPKTFKREIRSLLKASRELDCNELHILTYDTEKEGIIRHKEAGKEIIIMPVWKWMKGF